MGPGTIRRAQVATRCDLDAVEKKRPVIAVQSMPPCGSHQYAGIKRVRIRPFLAKCLEGQDGSPSGVIVEEALILLKRSSGGL
jgi:hypothetical protein